MKKIILICLMFISTLCFSQGEFYIGRNKVFKDSSNKIVSAMPFWYQNVTTEFGTSLGVTFNLKMGADDQGGFYFKKNGSTNLFNWGGPDGDFFRFYYGMDVTGDVDITGSFKVNGVAISAGGGDAYIGGHNTWTDGNIFHDTLRTNGLALFTNNVNVTGNIISNLNFSKGTNIRIGSTDAFATFFGSYNDTAMKIDTFNNVRFYENASVDGNLDVGANLGAATINVGDISSLGLADLNDVELNRIFIETGKITQEDYFGINAMTFQDSMFWFRTGNGSSLATLDPVSGFVTHSITSSGSIVGATVEASGNISAGDLTVGDVELNGSITTNISIQKGGIPNIGTTDNFAMQFITNNVAVIKVGTDTVHYYLPVKLKDKPLIFENTDGAKKATLSTNANGDLVISTNGAVAITGNVTTTGFTQLGSTGRREKTLVKSGYISTAGSWVTVAHGLANPKNIVSLSIVIHRDTTGSYQVLGPGFNATTHLSVGTLYDADATNFAYFPPATSTALAGDSVIFRAIYTDSY